MGLLIGLSFRDLGNSQGDLRLRVSVLFFSGSAFCCTGLYIVAIISKFINPPPPHLQYYECSGNSQRNSSNDERAVGVLPRAGSVSQSSSFMFLKYCTTANITDSRFLSVGGLIIPMRISSVLGR